MRVSYKKQVFPPHPEGLHQAVCVDLVDLGLEPNPFGGDELPKLRLYFQTEEINPETDKRFTVGKKYTVSLHEKANLRKDLETWRSRRFTDDELADFDLENLIGVNCQIQITHNVKDDGTVYGNITAIVPLGKGMVPMRAVDYVRKKDRPQENERPQQQRRPAPSSSSAGRGSAGQPEGKGEAYDDDVPF